MARSVLLLFLLLLPGCGVLTLPVSLPMALVQNKVFAFKAEIVDEEGIPLRGVIVHFTSHLSMWAPDPDISIFPSTFSKSYVVDGAFDSGPQWAVTFYVNLEKRGYERKKLTVNAADVLNRNPALDGMNGDMRIVMVKRRDEGDP